MSDFGRLVPRGGGDVIPLLHDRLTIGRRDSCDICLRFPNVSSLHCELIFKNGCWVIQDNNSKNGVKVNGDKLTTKKVLHPGDMVSIAKHEFVIDYNLSASKEALDDIMEEVEGIIEKPLLEKAGLAHPPRSSARPPSSPRLNLPPLTLNDAFDDDE
jgi:pSer/pThr/pTyr-binding forkhead associated (FHA) protein